MGSIMDYLFESSSRPIKILDGAQYTAEVIAELMDNHYKADYELGGIGRSQIYCGIASDMYQNRSRHENEDGHQIEYTCVFECKDALTAGLVEQLMKEKGYDIGDTNTFANGGKESSVFVYMYKK